MGLSCPESRRFREGLEYISRWTRLGVPLALRRRFTRAQLHRPENLRGGGCEQGHALVSSDRRPTKTGLGVWRKNA